MKATYILLATLVCLLLISGCNTNTSTTPPNDTSSYQDISLGEESTSIVELYATLSCFVADETFRIHSGFQSPEDVYAAYGFATAEGASYKMNSHIINEDVRSTLSGRIEALCPGAIPKEKIEEIINQLWRDAL